MHCLVAVMKASAKQRRGAEKSGALDSGWKDTINLSPKQYADVAIRFDDYAGRFLLHCHNLEHEDMAMMAAFQIT